MNVLSVVNFNKRRLKISLLHISFNVSTNLEVVAKKVTPSLDKGVREDLSYDVESLFTNIPVTETIN